MIPLASACKRLGADRLGKMQFICKAHHPVTPGRALLHDHIGADRPVIFAVAVVVEISATEVGADHQQDTISEP